MPGPPPKPAGERRRRNATVAMTQLPAEGRIGAAPEWPLPRLLLDEPGLVDLLEGREAELWAELWATPQAVAWERLKWTRTVARYVRFEVRAETGDLKAGADPVLRALQIDRVLVQVLQGDQRRCVGLHAYGHRLFSARPKPLLGALR